MGICMTEARVDDRAARLLVGDRAPLVAAALATWLGIQGHDVVARGSSAPAIAAALAEGGIDIAIVCIDLAGAVQPARRRGDRPAVKLIVIAPDAGHPRIGDVLARGADGLVLKSAPPETLEQCLAAVRAGGKWHDGAAMASADKAVEIGLLTPRERDVARLVAAGQRNRCIGEALGISEGTVKMHLHNVYAKLGIESRTQLATDTRLRGFSD